MKVYLKGSIIKSVKETFQDENTKEWVEYSKNWIDAEDEIVVLNSKEGFEDSVGKVGVIKLTLRADNKMFKVTLSGFNESNRMDEIENIEF